MGRHRIGPPLGGKPSQNAERRRVEIAGAILNGSRPMPLDIMLERMWELYAEKRLDAAAEQAEKCAPYLHPRLAAATVTHRDALDDLSVDQLRALLAITERAAGAIGGTIEGETEPALSGDEAGSV